MSDEADPQTSSPARLASGEGTIGIHVPSLRESLDAQRNMPSLQQDDMLTNLQQEILAARHFASLVAHATLVGSTYAFFLGSALGFAPLFYAVVALGACAALLDCSTTWLSVPPSPTDAPAQWPPKLHLAALDLEADGTCARAVEIVTLCGGTQRRRISLRIVVLAWTSVLCAVSLATSAWGSCDGALGVTLVCSAVSAVCWAALGTIERIATLTQSPMADEEAAREAVSEDRSTPLMVATVDAATAVAGLRSWMDQLKSVVARPRRL